MTKNTKMCYKLSFNLLSTHNKIRFVSYNTKNKRCVYMYFNPEEFLNFKNLLNVLSLKCGVGARYSILTKVLFVNIDEDSIVDRAEWKTLDEQIHVINDNMFESCINNYQDAIIKRLHYCEDKYEYKDLTLQGFQIQLYKVSYTDNVVPIKKVGLNSLGPSKDLLNVHKIKQGISSLPLSSNESSFGYLLNKQINNNSIEYITLLSGEKINFLNKINEYLSDEKKLLNIPANTDFYQKNTNITAVLTTKDSENKKVNNICVYDISGIMINNMIDKQIDEDKFSRKLRNMEIYIDTKGVYNKIIDWVFNYVRPKKVVGYFSKLIFSDSKIGCLDLETYENKFNISKTYAIGFYTKDNLNMFYLNKDLDSDKLIMDCLDKMLTEKYNGYTFYVHNLDGFDSTFLLKVMVDATNKYENIYDIKPLLRDEKILSINFSKRVGVKNKKYTIKFVDSYNILSSKLFKLCKTFNCNVKKGVFPYEFVRYDTIFYEGRKPSIDFYDYKDYVEDIDDKITINKIVSNLYNNIPQYNWSTEKETLKYLEKDLISLFEIMDTFKNRIFLKYYTHITRYLTISGLAMDLFLRKFYDNNIPLINKKSIYNDIKSSYFGGITEVYKPKGHNLYYYDVNSLYPYSALNTMPGLNCKYIENINLDLSEYKDDMFGFYYCTIITSKGYLGLLPLRNKDGVIMPHGTFSGWYFSEELKFAYKNGYKITIHKGYNFEKINNVFDKYVEEFYKLKFEAKDEVERNIAKSLLNNLLGRFGLKIDKFITELVNEDKYNEIKQTREIKGKKDISDMYLVTYSSSISQKICFDHQVDYYETLSKSLKNGKYGQSEEELHDVSIAIASAVTSYARIYMNKVKLDILKRGSIYYTDTDSIVTDVKLDESYVNNNLGMFKLEHKIKDAYFISNKTYSFINDKNKNYSRTKGIYQKSLNFDDFVKLYKGENVEGFRNQSTQNYSAGYTNIDKVVINISPNSYTKREKIHNNGLWTDTKPLFLS